MPRTAHPERRRARPRIAPVTPIGFPKPVSEALPEAVQRIVEALHPEKIVLFGSYAYGTATPDSDVDLLVVMETEAPWVQRYVAASMALVPRPFPVDVIVRTPDEIEKALASGDFFIAEILSRGQVLYERGRLIPSPGRRGRRRTSLWPDWPCAVGFHPST